MRVDDVDVTLINFLKYRAETEPNQIVYTFLSDKEQSTLTNAELLQKVSQIASQLLLITSSGSRAVLLLQPSLDYIIAFLGCLMAGVVAVPAYPPSNTRHSHRLFSVIKDAQAEAMITTSQISEQYSFENLRILLVDQLELMGIDETKFPKVTQNQLAFLQYTSGSTGNPKGVMVSHGNILANTKVISQLLKRDIKKVCSWLPPFHDMGLIGGILYPLTVKAHTILMPPARFLRKPFLWLKTISDYAVDISPAPNFAYELCINTVTNEEKTQLDLTHWQTALNGAEPVNAKTLEKFAQVFADCGFKLESCYPAYGMAETTLMVSGKKSGDKTVILHVDKNALKLHRIKKVHSSHPDKASLVSCGRADLNHEVKIVNPETNEILGNYEVGEIIIAGPSVAQGYWNKPDVTEQQFRFTLHGDGTHFLKTGDLGFMDENGELFITGRLKDLIIIRGQNIYPQDIEAVVAEAHPQLIPAGTAAFALEGEKDYELVIVQEVHRHAKNFEEIFSAILKSCSEEFSILPTQIVLIQQSTLSKTSSGKVQRNFCKQALQNQTLKTVAQWLRGKENVSQKDVSEQSDDLQLWMKHWLASELKINEYQIKSDVNFAHYGIDSLRAVRFCAALEEKLNQTINPSLLWTYSTVEQFANHLMGNVCETKATQFQEHLFEPIAIVGMSCRFPGQADNPEAFWQLLENAKDGITEVPPDRWNIDDYYDSRPTTPGKIISRKGGFVANIDQFDAALFDISPSEAAAMDPQHRLLLELTWEALEYGGIPPLSLHNTNSGVFIGISSNDYSHLSSHPSPDEANGFYGLGNAHSAAAGRIAYFFGTRGQTLAVDTACSSSLVAVFNACQDLQTKDCDLAIAGGVNLILDPSLSISFSQAGMLSPEGQCRVFDEKANGYVRGEGGGIIILKRLSDAEQDGNRILAVIKSAVVNSDGHSNGITAPSPFAQKELLAKALHSAGLTADVIGYVEAHGTGTRLGDPIEFNALKDVFATRSRKEPLYIGSVKTNLGHLEAAAGIAGLIKTILMLQHKKIPANLHFKQANPLIQLNDIPAQVPIRLEPWETFDNNLVRYAGISSFGFTGTNAHVILADAPMPEKASAVETIGRPVHILTLSAHTPEALNAQRHKLLRFIEQEETLDLASFCHSLNTERSKLDYKLAVCCRTVEELKNQLETASIEPMRPYDFKKIVFLFTGMGSQYSQMGSELYYTHPLFKAEIDYCCQMVSKLLPEPLQEVMFNPEKKELLKETQYAQPALFILEYALAQLWISWGIKPTAVIGHSLGEYVAATVAGMMSLEDGLKLIVWRAKLMQMQAHGSMLAVGVNHGKAKTLLATIQEEMPDKILAIAAINSPTQVVFSGEASAIEHLEILCLSQQIKITKLDVAHAFHSELLQPMIEQFTNMADSITYHKPTMLVISNVTGKALASVDATYWAKHVFATVNFSAGINYLLKKEHHIFFEMGAQPVLLSFAMAHHPHPNEALWFASLKRQQHDWMVLTETLMSIYLLGGPIEWNFFDKPYAIKSYPKVLPSYSFQREKYWLAIEEKPKEEDYLLERAIYQIGWEKLPLMPIKTGMVSGNWLIFANDQSMGFANTLRRCFENVIIIKPGTVYDHTPQMVTLNPKDPTHLTRLFSKVDCPVNVIYSWGVQKKPFNSDKELFTLIQQACAGLLYLVQAIGSKKNIDKILIVTNSALSPFSKERNPLSAPLVGMCKTLCVEYPEFACQLVDFETAAPDNEVTTHLLQLIESYVEETIIAVSQGNYYGQRLETSSLKKHAPCEIEADATYLITGGLGGIGFILSQWLIKRGARHIALLGRREMAQVKGQFEILDQEGATIAYFQTDVSQCDQLKNTLLTIQQTMPPLKGIFHTAGILADGLWMSLTWQQFTDVFQAKVLGSWHLHRLSIELDLKLQHFILFSSISSLLGSAGQTNYAAANAFLDGLAHYRHQLNLPALAINFGPWEQTGMTVHQTQCWLDAGILNITSQAGMAALEVMMMSSSAAQLCLLPHRISRDNIVAFPLIHKKLLARIVQADVPEKEEKQKHWQKLKDLGKEAQKLHIQEILQNTVKKVLRLERPIQDKDTLLSLGMDSLLAVDLLHQLKPHFPPEITLTAQVLLFENHSFQELVTLIHQQLIKLKDSDRQLKESDGQLVEKNVMLSANNQPIPLSVQQVRIWHHLQQQPNNPAYVVTCFLELHGSVDADNLEKSIQAVINRHDMLRCSFHTYLGNVVQYCHKEVPFSLIRLDVSRLSSTQRDVFIDEELRRASEQQFDVAQAPLLQSALIKCTDERTIWTMSISHLLTDGMSSLIILQDILHLYQLNKKQSHEEIPPAVSYQAFINWQLEGLVNDNYSCNANFWSKKLKNYEAPCLPVDKPRLNMAARTGKREVIPVTIEQLHVLQEIAKQNQTTIATILLTIYALLLANMAKTNHAFITVLTSGRDLEEYKTTVGNIANEVPIILHYSSECRFIELLHQLQNDFTQSLQYQYFQPEQMAELGLPTPDTSFDFQVLKLQQFDVGFTIKPISLKQSVLPLWGSNPRKLSMKWTYDGTLSGYIKYRSDLYKPETVIDFVQQFLRVLDEVIKKPTITCKELITQMEEIRVWKS
ncbi:type I polyketide synthase [Legionella jamestowniensis]|uniref:Polyketide synthase n=2 Tax=Legionella jamestowniensis TaxID=455 RepID=A0A0W0UUN0_9GAMM|nr:type I polyketide synthase [Legionella jamestowniensis]KTD11309.1 polyketide synthase [Legionella jamestowniensis]SFL69281.1 Acyl transferase domain-containing protein [Legionella jamestowniensis DSM 19215]